MIELDANFLALTRQRRSHRGPVEPRQIALFAVVVVQRSHAATLAISNRHRSHLFSFGINPIVAAVDSSLDGCAVNRSTTFVCRPSLLEFHVAREPMPPAILAMNHALELVRVVNEWIAIVAIDNDRQQAVRARGHDSIDSLHLLGIRKIADESQVGTHQFPLSIDPVVPRRYFALSQPVDVREQIVELLELPTI